MMCEYSTPVNRWYGILFVAWRLIHRQVRKIKWVVMPRITSRNVRSCESPLLGGDLIITTLIVANYPQPLSATVQEEILCDGGDHARFIFGGAQA